MLYTNLKIVNDDDDDDEDDDDDGDDDDAFGIYDIKYFSCHPMSLLMRHVSAHACDPLND